MSRLVRALEIAGKAIALDGGTVGDGIIDAVDAHPALARGMRLDQVEAVLTPMDRGIRTGLVQRLQVFVDLGGDTVVRGGSSKKVKPSIRPRTAPLH